MTKNTPDRKDTAKQYRRIRKLLKANGYLAGKNKIVTEAHKVKQEGRA